MSPTTASIVFAIGIFVLFLLDRNEKERASLAIWIPVVWLSIGGSRMVSQWLQIAPATSADQLIEGSPLDRSILMGLMALGIYVLVQRRRAVARILRGNLLVVVFLAYCALSTAWSDYPLVALKRWFKTCGDIVMVMLVLTDPNPAEAMKRVFARFGFLLIPTSILLIKYYPELGRGYANYTWEPVVMGVTTGKNLLGMICMISGAGALWRLLHEIRSNRRGRVTGPVVAQCVLLAMITWLFWLANSMTSLLCFLLAGIFTVVGTMTRLAERPLLLHSLVVLALGVAASVLFLNVGGSFLSSVGRDPSLTGRTDVWEAALRYADNPIFGAGYESFWLGERLEKIWAIFWWHPNEAHNGYLEVYLNLGWAGVLLFALVLLSGYRHIIASLKHDREVGACDSASLWPSLRTILRKQLFEAFNHCGSCSCS